MKRPHLGQHLAGAAKRLVAAIEVSVAQLLFANLDGQPRHLDTIWPLWNVFDLLPQGRGSDWYPAIDYGANT